MAKVLDLVDSQVKSLQTKITLKSLKCLHLILLQVEFLKVDQSTKTLQILDVVALTCDDCQVGELLKALQTHKFVLSGIKLGKGLQMTHILDCSDFVVAHV